MQTVSTVRPRTRWTIAAASAALLVAAGIWVAGPAGAAAGCQVTYKANQWQGGFTADITVDVGATAVNGWTVTWTYGGGQQVSNAWNAVVSQSGAAVTARNESYNGQVAAGASVNFGLQGTFSSANPAPTDFALNGTPCGGAGTPSSPAVPSSPAAPSSAPPSSAPPSSARPSTSPSQGGGGCGGAVVCDGFENQAGTAPSGAWSTSFPNCSGAGTATVDSTVVHSGTRSLRVDGAAGYCNHVFVGSTANVTTIGAVWYGRFYVRHTTALPAAHVTFMAMKDSADANNDLRMGGQNAALQWNRQSDDATLPAQSPAGVALSVALPTNAWECVEFMVNGSTGTMDTWLNGTQVAGLHNDGVPTQDVDQQWLSRANWRPTLTDFRLGWESYGDGADTLWYDDVAVGASRIGC
jgi:hypothetical protein